MLTMARTSTISTRKIFIATTTSIRRNNLLRQTAVPQNVARSFFLIHSQINANVFNSQSQKVRLKELNNVVSMTVLAVSVPSWFMFLAIT